MNWLAPNLATAQDSAATVVFRGSAHSAEASLSGILYGPLCALSRTLPTEHRVTFKSMLDGVQGVAHIPDPCYWSQELPFLYQLTVRWQGRVGEEGEFQQTVGLRRLFARGRSFYWDARRTVLRGVEAKEISSEMIDQAHEARIAIVAPSPSTGLCDLTDARGVVLVADMRGQSLDIARLAALAARPSVALIVFDGNQFLQCDRSQLPNFANIALDASDISSPSRFSTCDAIVVELKTTRPEPALVLAFDKPAIAIRRGESYANFREARLACDRLQADLAPDYDLAGYFVAKE